MANNLDENKPPPNLPTHLNEELEERFDTGFRYQFFDHDQPQPTHATTPKVGAETADIQSRDLDVPKGRNQGKLEFDTTEVNKVIDEALIEMA